MISPKKIEAPPNSIRGVKGSRKKIQPNTEADTAWIASNKANIELFSVYIQPTGPYAVKYNEKKTDLTTHEDRSFPTRYYLE